MATILIVDDRASNRQFLTTLLGRDEEAQARMLLRLGCDEMQGYLFSKPIPFAEMTGLLNEEAKS